MSEHLLANELSLSLEKKWVKYKTLRYTTRKILEWWTMRPGFPGPVLFWGQVPVLTPVSDPCPDVFREIWLLSGFSLIRHPDRSIPIHYFSVLYTPKLFCELNMRASIQRLCFQLQQVRATVQKYAVNRRAQCITPVVNWKHIEWEDSKICHQYDATSTNITTYSWQLVENNSK